MSTPYYFYRTNGILMQMHMEAIDLMEVNKNYVRFVNKNGYVDIRTTLENALAQFPKNYFIQVHRSYAVAFNQIDKLGKDSLFILSRPELEIPVSRKYYKELLKHIKIIGPDLQEPDQEDKKIES
ncbi:LytTR family DNA-binding domain-containing protein [Flavihumibacter sp.]|uniref:LytTR family DNA-binding domain-containing protein n=1 Tax=Flavihumibacter sp. TaxID=1913981 RepID=UPI002FC85E3D